MFIDRVVRTMKARIATGGVEMSLDDTKWRMKSVIFALWFGVKKRI